MIAFFFWFPRAGVVTHSGRASVQFLWVTRRWRVAKAFPRRRVNAINLRADTQEGRHTGLPLQIPRIY